MAEPLYLEMPEKQKGTGAKSGRRMVLALAVSVVLAVLAVAGWLLAGRLESAHAMLDGMVTPVASDRAGRLEALLVREGDTVTAGQAVARMDMKDYLRHLGQAGREAAALRPPDMVEMAARIQEAQRAEREMVERLAGLRHEEDALRRMREEKVAEHVRAQLALRALNSQNGEPVMAARKAEAEARLAMDKARDAFEMASRARAATERELGRIRDEVQRARDIASQGRYGQWAQAVPLLPDVPDGTLYAPVAGLVLSGSARPGQTVGSGDPILLIAPEGTGERHPYWLQAFFPEEAARAIHTGQACKVRFTVSDASLSAHVAEVGAPGPMPAGGPVDSGQSSVTGRFVPVRITLDDALPQGVRPGSAAKCTVATHSLFGFSALF